MKKLHIIALVGLLIFVVVLIGCRATTQQPAPPDPAPTEASVPAETAEPAMEIPAAKPDPAAETEAQPLPCILTDDEILLLAELMTCEAEVVKWDGVKYGVSAYARIAAVAWIALNRFDSGDGATLEATIKRPGQFAWKPGIEAPADLKALATDIADRYTAEWNGQTDVGRTIPADYFYFYGDGRENYFRKQYEDTGEIWDWSLPDPYAE